MLIKCEKCLRVYEIDEARLSCKKNLNFRCSACGYCFQLPSDETAIIETSLPKDENVVLPQMSDSNLTSTEVLPSTESVDKSTQEHLLVPDNQEKVMFLSGQTEEASVFDPIKQPAQHKMPRWLVALVSFCLSVVFGLGILYFAHAYLGDTFVSARVKKTIQPKKVDSSLLTKVETMRKKLSLENSTPAKKIVDKEKLSTVKQQVLSFGETNFLLQANGETTRLLVETLLKNMTETSQSIPTVVIKITDKKDSLLFKQIVQTKKKELAAKEVLPLIAEITKLPEHAYKVEVVFENNKQEI